MLPDASDVDAAIVTKLQSDAPLAALAQAGAFVFMDEAPAGSTKFVVVSLVDHVDEPMFGGTAFEDALYLVKWVELKPATGSGNAKAGAARIQALLHLEDLTIPGYGLMVMRRQSRVRFIEKDDADESIRWFHRGGRYQVMAAPQTT